MWRRKSGKLAPAVEWSISSWKLKQTYQVTEDRTGCRGILRQWSWGHHTFPSVHSFYGTEKAEIQNEMPSVRGLSRLWLLITEASLQDHLLYCWPSESGNIYDEKHFIPVAVERNLLSIQSLHREIIDRFIRHACSLARVQTVVSKGWAFAQLSCWHVSFPETQFMGQRLFSMTDFIVLLGRGEMSPRIDVQHICIPERVAVKIEAAN